MSVATTIREPASDPLDLYRVRDDLAQQYSPPNAFERMLLSQVAQSWIRLQRAQDAECRYFQSHDVLDAITTDFKRYQSITRLVSQCDRAWNRAKWQLEKAQSTRKRGDTSSPNARRRPVELASATASGGTDGRQAPSVDIPARESVPGDPPYRRPSG